MTNDTIRLAILGGAVSVVAGLSLAGGLALLLSKLGRRPIARWERRAAWSCLGALAVGLGCYVYGTTVEADWIEVTHLEVRTPKLPAGQRLRIAHLTDAHADGWTPALRALPALVNAEKPDVVIFTGDALNSEAGRPVLASLFNQLEAPLGRYAVWGNQDVWYYYQEQLYRGSGLHVLHGGIPVALQSASVSLCGATFGSFGLIPDCLEHTPAAFSILAYHTPDLVESLDPAPDLYLAGHTHGGQVRLPFYGALVTLSKFDKKYEAGRYRVGPTTLYVNRGVGFEGGTAPRVRFLCRPELAIIEVVGEGKLEAASGQR